MGAAAALKTGTAIAKGAATWTRPYSQSQKEIESLWLIRSWVEGGGLGRLIEKEASRQKVSNNKKAPSQSTQ